MNQNHNSANFVLEEMRHLGKELPRIRDHKVSYPLEKFTQYFAPFFLGFHEVPQGQNLFEAWRLQVGSLHCDVSVVSTDGTEVFMVPAIMDTSAVNLLQNAKNLPTFKALENQMELESRNFPAEAATSYQASLNARIRRAFEGVGFSPENFAKWVRIFNYYQVPPDVMEQNMVRLGMLQEGEKLPTFNQNTANSTTQQPMTQGSIWNDAPQLF